MSSGLIRNFLTKTYFFVRYLLCFKRSCFTFLPIPSHINNPEYCIDIKGSLNSDEDVKKEIPKMVWMYWDSEDIDSNLQRFILKVQELNKDYKVVILNRITVFDYLPDLKFNEEVYLSPAHKSDVIRLCLLRDYGGIWIDVTTVFFQDLSWVQKKINDYPYDLIGFFRKVSTQDFNRPVIENWFLAAPPNNKFIKDWLTEFLPIADIGSTKFYDLMKSRSDFFDIKQRIDNTGYLLSYLAAHIVMKNNDYSFFLRCCEENAFFYQRIVDWRPHLVTYLLSRVELSDSKPEIIKLTKSDRMLINLIITFKLIKRQGLLSFLKR